MTHLRRLGVLLLFCCYGVSAQVNSLQIPSSHPRLWWNPQRIQTARAWYASHPFTPDGNDPVGQALRYVMTGETSYARSAINWAMNVTFSTSGTASNEARWYGEQAILIYDWCHAHFTAAERSTFIARWNGYLNALSDKSWGGLEMPQNNYYWGYLRNELLWGIASYNENSMATTFLNHALVSRWQGSFLPHALTGGRGGVPHEGTQYGRYLLGYSVVPLVTASLLGRPLHNETDFFKSAVFYLIYATTPGPTDGRYELFPNNDDQFWSDGGSAEDEDLANFMATAAGHWSGTPVSEYARRWLTQTGAEPQQYIQSTFAAGPQRDFTSLPLDYFAPGPQHLFGRNMWGPTATTFHVQLGPLAGHGHSHDDLGNWQMWRNGRWLSRETVAYGDTHTGYGGSGSVNAASSVLHNTILMNGRGMAGEPTNGSAVVRRLESRPDYSYMVADLTPTYRNTEIPFRRPERDNAAVSHVEREYVFIRPLESMIILDRLESTAASVVKTFLAHFEQQPVVEGARNVLAVNGNQALRLTTLAPQTASYRVVNEGGSEGQYRLEVDATGATQGYFLHVLQARDASGQNLQAAMTESATSFTITLSHPTRGHCRLVFQKGMTSSGGGIACSAAAMPAQVQPFTSGVQRISVGNNGPVWEGAPAPGPDNTPPTISGITAVPGINTATVVWATTEPATSQVEYGPTAAYGSASVLNGAHALVHNATLTNLTAGALYHYRVLSRDAAGNLAVSADRTFSTTSPPVQFTITTIPGANGSITPAGPVIVASGATQAFQITPASQYRIADVQVNGTSVGAVSTYTLRNITSNTVISAAFALIPPTEPPPGPSGQTVPITVHAYASGNGPANLVSNSIPFKPGALSNAGNLRVLDGAVEVPAATRVLATWPQDGSIRALLVQFSASFTGASKNFTIQIGTPRTANRTFTAVSWDLPTRIFTLSAAYLTGTAIFGDQLPLGQTAFAAWENKLLGSYDSIEAIGNAPCARNDQYYDSTSTTYKLYAASGQLQYLVNARRWALHHRRDQVYLTGSNVGHPQCTGGYLNNTRYSLPEGLINDYFMFGDEEARRVSGLIVDNFYMDPDYAWWWYKAPNTRGFWTEREPAFALIGVMAHYEATGDQRYLTFVRDRIASLHRMQVENGRRAWVHNLYDHDPSEGCSTSDYGSSPWMSGLLLEAVIKYHRITGDAIARESVLMAVDDLRTRHLATADYAGRSFVYLGCSAYSDGTPDLDNLIAHAFGYAYKLTGNQTYRTVGQNIFNTAVASGYAGAHKQYNQQFRSSPHFIAYVASPATGAPGGDTTDPAVSITSPSANQSVTGTITATSTAADNVGVTGVQFLVDGQPHGAEDTSSPYSVSVNTTTLPNGTHTIAARARDAAGNTGTSTAVSFTVNNTVTTAPGLSAHWSFNEASGTAAADSSGNANTATLINGTTWAAGRVGAAVNFDGVNDSVQIPDSPSLRANDFTLALWLRSSNMSGIRSVISKPIGISTHNSYVIYLDNGRLTFHSVNYSGHLVSAPLTANVWHHVAVVKQGTSTRLYINGAQAATANTAPVTVSYDNHNLLLGTEDDGRGTEYFFAGLLDDVRVYGRALSTVEIANLIAY